MTEDVKEYVCINCGSPVKNLYKKYSETVLKLTECEICNSIADKYVEYDTVIIIIDLILLRSMAYKHILLNSEFKNFWKLSIILLLLETYSDWTISTRDIIIEVNDTQPYLAEADIYLQDFKFYKMCINITINTLCFMVVIYIFTITYNFLKSQETISFLMIYKTVTLSSTGLFLFLPSLIWDISVYEFHLHFISIYTTLSQLLAYKALCNCEKIWSLLVIFTGLMFKSYVGDSLGIKAYGYWVWNDLTNELNCLSGGRDAKDKEISVVFPTSTGLDRSSSLTSVSSKIVTANERSFNKTVGKMSQQRFRKYFQRKVKMFEPEVVTLQDVKDVAIYKCNVTLLTPEFISYFHSQSMDNFLRSLIVYFQYYFQVWNKMQLRRIESKRKLRQPIVTELENIVRDDLADLRSMVARSYSVILLGIGDAKTFHHMNNNNNDSFSDRDRRLFESLMMMTLSVVWIALSRKYLKLIEKELNRMLRTNLFSPSEHSATKNPLFDTLPEEDRILTGRANTVERKLLHRSPAVQELIFDNHDYRMLAIGVTDTECSDPRQIYLEAAYTAPEELLYEMKIPVGILGVPRRYLDSMLKIIEISPGKRMSILKSLPEFVLPPKIPYKTKGISKTLTMKPCKYPETEATTATRNKQCKMWRRYVETNGETPNKGVDFLVGFSPPPVTSLQSPVLPINLLK